MNPNQFRWTPQDDQIALRHDIGVEEMAALLGRTYDAVVMRRSRLRDNGRYVPRGPRPVRTTR